MYNIAQLKELLQDKKMDEKFSSIYGGDEKSISEAYGRLSDTIKHFENIDKSQEVYLFSASGRTELSGNHTDHNNGCVLTASINLDKLALVAKRNDNKIVVYTDYSNNPDVIDVNNLELDKDEYGKSNALIRGVCAGIKNKGYQVGGCTVSLNNKVLMGSGLSSSASFESLIGEIQNALYNDNKISPVDIAKMEISDKEVSYDWTSDEEVLKLVSSKIAAKINNSKKPVILFVRFLILALAKLRQFLDHFFHPVQIQMGGDSVLFNRGICHYPYSAKCFYLPDHFAQRFILNNQ